MTTKIERCRRFVNDSFSTKLAEAVASKFDGLKVETHWNIISMSLVTTRTDEVEFTPEQYAFIGAYSNGYEDALTQIARAE